MKSTRHSFPSVFPLSAAAFRVGALLALMAGNQARAQDIPESVEGIDALGPKPSVWIERRITVGQTLSSNGSFSSNNARSDQIAELTPGIRAVFNTARVQGFLDYSLSALYYAQGTSGNQFRNALNANATVNAWDNRAFVDLSGVVSNQSVSAFGSTSLNGLSDANRSETASFRFSPYLRGSFAGDVDYELRYSVQTADTDTVARSDIIDQATSLRLVSRNEGQTLGWSFSASSGTTNYSRGRDTQSSSAQAGLIMAPSQQLLVTLLAGAESNDIISVQKQSYNTTGIDLDWRPSERTRFLVGFENRYFGTGHNIALEHTTGQTVWRYTDSRGAVNNPLQEGAASLGSAYAFFDALVPANVTNPVERARIVSEQLQLFGLGINDAIFQNFLTSSATLDRVQRISVALVGVRSVWTLAGFRSNSRRLDTIFLGGDDFDLNTNIEQQGWSLSYAHRMTPLTALNAVLTRQRTLGSAGFSARSTTASLGLSTRLTHRTIGSLQVQRGTYSGSSGSYNETAISGFITHRF
jgi:uncharacterized protein (PEP-CTERM system associated)